MCNLVVNQHIIVHEMQFQCHLLRILVWKRQAQQKTDKLVDIAGK